MIRYTFFVLVVIGSAASALAAIAPGSHTGLESTGRNVTVVEKNQAFPQVGPLVVEECLDDACTVTRG